MSTLKDVDLLDGTDEELVASTPQQRNWKGIVTALLVIFVMCSLIGLAILIFTPMDVDADGLKLPILLTDVMRLNFMSPIESMDWVNDRFLTIKYGDSVEMLDLRYLLTLIQGMDSV
uniref:Dipeptidyl aminopeptidase-like protein 6 n=1 Tax=Acrobeloides nanus TaxID=290746 RepID=A0A914CKI9_9BILA